MASRYINGNELMLTLDGAILGAAKSHSITVAATSIDTSNKESGKWEGSEPGRLSFSIKADGFVAFASGATSGQTNYDKLFDLMNAMSNVTIISKRSTADGSGIYTGSVTIESLDETSNFGEMVTYSVSLKGNGELVKS